ncbi:MAG: sodium ion-translocating decarboxylase subunit beta [Rhodoplanes sp.]|uniref:sodium ion-translocating decarboxylase subunit beta n=1 Tax=Rhodoplanes sp. TaxID=1968906 RepID=UPI0017F1887C|nr:sodium ion-translocating decarboxylase subunit beta [Rhodoplanes sp.]NVO16006.1 sodium ion-translocating decarboxylase subunit beta [Rhodoplanes sp.]
MIEGILTGLLGLTEGVQILFTIAGLKQIVMLIIGGTLIFLGVKKDVEPLLLVPIGFGCVLVNIPGSELMHQGIDIGAKQVLDALGPNAPEALRALAKDDTGFLRSIYNMGIANELFPLLIFIGIGAMTDFGPLLENPKILLFGAAGQCGIFLTLLLALWLGFPHLEAVSIAVIGACDGPTAIYVASQYAPQLLGPISVAAYSYMALVPIIQPPIMKALTTDKERKTHMPTVKRTVSLNAKVMFPIIVTIVTGLIAPKGLPLMASIMLGNFMRECGAVSRLTKASENEIANIATLFLGIAIGATMAADDFLKPTTLAIFALGFVAICLDTIVGVLFGKIWYTLSGGKVNPLIGAAGISAFPMAARVVQAQGQRYDKRNFLLMHAMGANCGGQIGSVAAAAVMLSVLKGLGLI